MASKKKQEFKPTFRGYPAKGLEKRVKAMGLTPTAKNKEFFINLSEIAHAHPSVMDKVIQRISGRNKLIREHGALIGPLSKNNNMAKNILVLFNRAKAEQKANGGVLDKTHAQITQIAQYLKSPNDKMLIMAKQQFALALEKFEKGMEK
jgi:hypothetical protein